jgi:hypothetical protein
MRPNKKLERQAVSAHYVKKTAADFMRWCGEQDALKKRAAEEATTPVDDAMSRALMVWADDGGVAA